MYFIYIKYNFIIKLGGIYVVNIIYFISYKVIWMKGKNMKINEIKTKKLTREILESHVRQNCSAIKFYGKCGNNIFLMKDNNTGVFNLERKKFLIPYQEGISCPVVDDDNNTYFLGLLCEFKKWMRIHSEQLLKVS